MAYRKLLAVALGLTVVPAFAGQDPSMDLQFAAPALDDQAAIAVPDDKVSVSFKRTKAAEIIDWLEKAGVSFVIEDGSIPDEKTITLNLVNQPLDDAIDAIGFALGGSFEKRNAIYVFRKGLLTKDIWSLSSPATQLAIPPAPFKGPNPPGPVYQWKTFSDKSWANPAVPQGTKFLKEFKTPQAFTFAFPSDKSGSFTFTTSTNLPALQKSLTAKQKETMKKRGYLTPKDLTAKQVSYLGGIKGKFEVRYSDDKNNSLVIKSQ